MQTEIIHALGLSVVFVVILMLGECIYRVIAPDNPEISRKSVHFMSGLVSLSLPYLITSHWLVLLLAAVFMAITVAAKKMGRLKSIHGIGRKSYGAVYFPLAIYGMFLLGHTKPVLYFISIMVMTVSDSLAALLGGRYGSIKYDVEGNYKSLEGSVVFFFVTFLCVHLPLLLMTQAGRLDSVMTAVVIALLITGFEAVSLAGSDNIFIPFGTYYILSKKMQQPLVVSAEDIWKLLFLIAVAVLVAVKSRLWKPSGLIGMVLINYAAWSLCDIYWFLPLILAQAMLYLLSVYFTKRVEEEIAGYQIKVFIYSAIVPAIIIFTANTIDNYATTYIPYLTAVAGQIAIMCYFFMSIMTDKTNGHLVRLRRNKYLSMVACGITSTLGIAALPLFLYFAVSKLSSLCLVAAGVLIALCIFHLLMTHYHLRQQMMLRQKMRLVSVGLAAVTTLIIQYWLGGVLTR